MVSVITLVVVEAALGQTALTPQMLVVPVVPVLLQALLELQ
jgi:hypothetical protein